jgi:nucleotide-binding universal stress UspA family protein
MSALEMGRALAEEQHGKVTLLHVLELLAPEDAHVVSHYQVSEYVAMRRQEARKQLQAVLPDPAGTWRDPCDRVELGSPAKTILRVAEDLHADLIAMGAQSHGALARLFLGSTTHTVVRRATCPDPQIPVRSAAVSSAASAPRAPTISRRACPTVPRSWSRSASRWIAAC